jgi:hypothetical protein
MTEIGIAVISDIHAEDRGGARTHVLSEPPTARRGVQPLADLSALVDSIGLVADYLVVPGDIANEADAGGLSYGWRKVHALADQMGATLLAVPGNHDVITHAFAADPRAMLKRLLPGFPTGDVDLDRHFWSHGWVIFENPDHRFLLLDSTRTFPPFPSGSTKGDPEWDAYMDATNRGGLSEVMEDEIEAAFEGASAKLNVALVHHHPQEHQLKRFLRDEYGAMHRGGELIDLLSRHPSMGRWMIVHGHKHIPQLSNATALTTNGPLVMCSASLGAKIWPPIDTIAHNQFHLVQASDSLSISPGTLMGRVRSFTWGFGEGWHQSERSAAGLPATSGFGGTEDFRRVATRITDVMNADSFEFIRYRELTDLVPQIDYLLPQDFEFLETQLLSVGFEFTRDRFNSLVQLSRRGTS